MKKILCILLSACFALTVFASCGKKSSSGATEPAAPGAQSKETETAAQTQNAASDPVDVDLTKMSSTMIYAEVLNMTQTAPEDYLGKTIRIKGNFTVSKSEEYNRNYYWCVIPDATACCSQGIEFILDGNPDYPLDYPELNSEITVEGVYESYREGDYTYYQLSSAKLI